MQEYKAKVIDNTTGSGALSPRCEALRELFADWHSIQITPQKNLQLITPVGTSVDITMPTADMRSLEPFAFVHPQEASEPSRLGHKATCAKGRRLARNSQSESTDVSTSTQVTTSLTSSTIAVTQADSASGNQNDENIHSAAAIAPGALKRKSTAVSTASDGNVDDLETHDSNPVSDLQCVPPFLPLPSGTQWNSKVSNDASASSFMQDTIAQWASTIETLLQQHGHSRADTQPSSATPSTPVPAAYAGMESPKLCVI